MKDACFIVPVHEARFESDVLPLIESYHVHYGDDHLFLVFSTKEEFEVFSKMSPVDFIYQPIIVDYELTYSKPITEKKFYGLRWVFENTDFKYAGVVDCDARFIDRKDYALLFRDYHDRKKVFSSRVENKGINEKVGLESCYYNFDCDDFAEIVLRTDNFLQYFWFNDIPVYERETFKAFDEYVQPNGVEMRSLKYTDFDYNLYTWYRIISDTEFELVDIAPGLNLKNGSFLECQNEIEQELFEEVIEKIQPMWLVDPSGYEDMPKLFMRFHTDR